MGDTALEAATDQVDLGQAEAFAYTATSSGTTASVTLYFGTGTTASSVVVGVYANTAGRPGTLLGQATFTAPRAAAWSSTGLPNVAITSGTTYWLAVMQPASSTGVMRFRDRATGGTSQSASQTGLSSLPSVWSPGTTWPTSSMSAYLSP